MKGHVKKAHWPKSGLPPRMFFVCPKIGTVCCCSGKRYVMFALGFPDGIC